MAFGIPAGLLGTPAGLLGTPDAQMRQRQLQRLHGLLQAPGMAPSPAASAAASPAASSASPASSSASVNPWVTDRGEASRDAVHGKSFDQMTNNEIQAYAGQGAIGRNAGRVGSGIVGPPGWGLMMGLLENSQLTSELANRGLSNPGDYVGGKVTGGAGTSLGMSPELAGRNGGADMFAGKDLDLAGSVGESPGLYSEGGRVDSALIEGDPPGPDDVIIGAKTGERVITEDMFSGFSKSTKAEINAAMKRAKRK